eukprot:jgi/Botrbrau1/16973/Bobra.49_2s0034.1
MEDELFDLLSQQMKEGGTAPDPGIDVTYVVNTNIQASQLCEYYFEALQKPKFQNWAVDRVRQSNAVKPVAVRLGEKTPKGPPVYVTGRDGRSHN